MNKNIKRGQVWFYKPTTERPGHIQKGPRPVIIVSNDITNEHSPVVLAVPCTSQLKRNYPTHVLFVLNNGVSVALTEQAGPVCVDELLECKFTLPKYVMDQIDIALSYAYGLKPMPVVDSPQQVPPQPKPIQRNNTNDSFKERTRWTASLMKKFLLDFSMFRSVDDVAAKYGLSAATAKSYKSKFETLVGPQKGR